MSVTVVDASFVLTFLIKDEQNTHVDEVFMSYEEGKINFVAPSLLSLEVMSGLCSAVRRKRITSAKAKQLLNYFLELEIEKVDPDYSLVLRYALKHGLSVYDASYLALAKQKHAKIFTRDKHLLKFYPNVNA